MAKKIQSASNFDVAQIKIFDDTHEAVEKQFNEFCSENGLKTEDIEIRHRQGDRGSRYTYLVVLYQIKNPVK